MDENRVYKFRGFDEAEQCWRYGSLITKMNPHKVNDEMWCYLIHDGALTSYVVANESVGEYVGLKDKNEKEIYEGDIVKFLLPNEHEGETEYIEEVQYEGSCFCLDGNVPVDAFASELEIIGNIYENETLINK